ncbi:flagellar protein FlgN [Alteraurantiacibacter aquimixticola]|uniref:Flagellar protein FlgN n=2 Tax=Alteraurantiacibacter aquimixticola TaxID=2489173 RepID=A0A4T3F4L0_9SPHN|nr:flagellar protein FlgN [Alteraurantiacibacter aquimixticola]
MLAVLDDERQALAALDVDALLASSTQKHSLCAVLEAENAQDIDSECTGLLEAARHQNEVNRKVRNLLAANVAARLDALTRSPALYSNPAAVRA